MLVHLLSWRWTEFKLFQPREREAPRPTNQWSEVLTALNPLPGPTGKWSHRKIKHLKKDPAAVTTVSHPTSDSRKTCDLSTNNHQPESGPDCEQVPANCGPTSAAGPWPGIEAIEPTWSSRSAGDSITAPGEVPCWPLNVLWGPEQEGGTAKWQ